ncbi:UNVERIFIED_ORG: hypothetical protein M2438_002688 [Methylobacterium sp. SuP10 SLI 274]|uniref:VRR-NUC domain-containing protein n=1 Tax=Methylorubrum extorquens TaxID=408 RepID=UPI0020A1CAAA|nr:VRR-NUC domain-containing protein [Methylorubrum extorquens]MDF9863920.1 hypothetical protein [Methylorubrum pseudosasae]MDH6637513.1 hypothetical protein [Methylobacterium sp. SuP10 SLI 274]MDH6666693.1 hypothetical protein [Methylorubrum zatmanii]MCP1558601.1 hypothetical protein [Methylorubrum extorquens]MDF9792230.1 hypothetical protein [Methylorubrum extorquens]
MNRPEQKIQTAIVVALRRRFDCFPFHVPNGGARTRLEAIAFKDAGTTAGVPDLPVLGRDGSIFFLEIKAKVQVRERNVPPTERIHSCDPAQKLVIADFRARGFTVAIVDSVEDAVAVAEACGLTEVRKPIRSQAAISTGF